MNGCRIKSVTGFIVCALSSSVHAYSGHAVVSIAAGAALNYFENLTLPVTSTETDILHQTGHNAAFLSALRAGYDMELTPAVSCYIHDLLIGFGLYNINLKDEGKVYQFGSSELKNFKYDLPVYTTRLMVEGKLTGYAWHSVHPYLMAGIGASWNRASYSDTSTFDHGMQISLDRREQMKFAYEIAVGAQTFISQAVSVFAEYMYADLGHAKTSSYGNTQIVSAVVVPLHVNSISVGLGYSF